MAANSKIEWTDHTFNIREGCQKVSPACDICYAWLRDKHWHAGKNWGPLGERKQMAEAYWRQPLKWDKEAAALGQKHKVFCSSLADWGEKPPRPELRFTYESQLRRLGALIDETTNLIWLLLTKRPENWPWAYRHMGYREQGETHTVPRNIFPMTTVENQEYADKRIPKLLEIPSALGHGISYEPALGPIDLNDERDWLTPVVRKPKA